MGSLFWGSHQYRARDQDRLLPGREVFLLHSGFQHYLGCAATYVTHSDLEVQEVEDQVQ